MAGKSPSKSPNRPGKNGGLLRTGNPGNIGGTGRPPSALREKLRGSFEERIAVLEHIADGFMPLRETCEKCGHEPSGAMAAMPTEASDRLRAIDMMGKYGMGETVGMDDIRERLKAQVAVIRTVLPNDSADLLLNRLAEVWR